VSLLTILAASILPTTQCTASSAFTTTTNNNNNIEKNDHGHRYTQTTTTAFQFPNLQQLTQSLTNPKSATPTTTSIQQEDELLNAITESGSTKRLDNSQNKPGSQIFTLLRTSSRRTRFYIPLPPTGVVRSPNGWYYTRTQYSGSFDYW